MRYNVTLIKYLNGKWGFRGDSAGKFMQHLANKIGQEYSAPLIFDSKEKAAKFAAIHDIIIYR